MSKLREQLIRIQRTNYQRNKRLVSQSLDNSSSVERYEKEYWRCLKNYQGVSTKAELMKKVVASDIVYHGDYHTLRQSQRSILRVLREIHEKRDLIVCLELFHSADQKMVQQFLSGNIDEPELLKKINYEKKWPFPWEHWSPIVEFCKEHGILVIGINSGESAGSTSLKQRDKYAAKIISKAHIRHPDKLIYIVVGDYHVSPNHLPKEVGRLLTIFELEAKTLILYQNAENLYWKLCREGLEDSDVLKIDDASFCVMNTLPVNKIQSYLSWLEYSEDAYYPIHGEWEDETLGGRGLTIQKMVHTIASIIGLPFPEEALDRLTIYYPNNLYFMDFIDNTPELKGSLRSIKDKIKRDEGFFLEFVRSEVTSYIIYLPNSNINMAAEEAAHLVHAVVRGKLQNGLSPLDRFYRSLITECLGFFGSKFINEKRRSQSENSIRRFLGMVKQGKFKKMDPGLLEGAHLLLQHLFLEQKSARPEEFAGKFSHIYARRSYLSELLYTQLGYVLGNKLYYAVKSGKFSMDKVRALFKEQYSGPFTAFNAYMDLVRKLATVRALSVH